MNRRGPPGMASGPRVAGRQADERHRNVIRHCKTGSVRMEPPRRLVVLPLPLAPPSCQAREGRKIGGFSHPALGRGVYFFIERSSLCHGRRVYLLSSCRRDTGLVVSPAGLPRERGQSGSWALVRDAERRRPGQGDAAVTPAMG